MYCYRIARIRINRPEEAEVMLNELGSKGFHVVGMREFSNDLIVVMEKDASRGAGWQAAPIVKRGPGRPRKVTDAQTAEDVEVS